MALFSSIGVYVAGAVGVALAAGSIAAVVVGVVVAIAVIAVISAVVMALMGGAGSAPTDQGVRQRVPTDPSNKLPIVYGNRKSAGSITMADISPNNEYMYFIISLAEGPCESIGKVYYDDKLVFFEGQGDYDEDDVQGSIDGNIGLTGVTELRKPTTVVGDRGYGEKSKDLLKNIKFRAYPQGGRCVEMEEKSVRWRKNKKDRTMPDTAYVYIELRYSAKRRVHGLSNRIGFYLEGKKIRTFGVNGTLSTELSYSRNPGEILVDYLTNPIYGCNLADKELDLNSFFDHTRFCGEMVGNLATDGRDDFSPRYEINGVINPKQDLDRNISDICMNSGAWFTYTLGRFGVISDKSQRVLASDTRDIESAKDGLMVGKIYIIHDTGQNGSFSDFGASNSPSIGESFVATRSSVPGDIAFTGEAEEVKRIYTEEDMYGEIDVSSGGFDSMINRLTFEFPSDDQGQQEYDQLIIDTRVTPAPGVGNPYYIDPSLPGSLANLDEPLLEKTLKMHLSRGSVQAERLAAITLNNSRQTISVRFTVDLSSLDLRAGELIALRHATPGWGYKTENFDPMNLELDTPKIFRVSEILEEAKGDSISLHVSASEYSSQNYQDRTIQKRDFAPNTGFRDATAAPDIGSTVVRGKIAEYSFEQTSLDDIDVTINSSLGIPLSLVEIGKTYRISSLGDTLPETFNVIAGTTGVSYPVGSLITIAGFATIQHDVTQVLAGKVYQIVSLGDTTQANWNFLAGTSGANYVVNSTISAISNGGAGLGSGVVKRDAGTGEVAQTETYSVNIPAVLPDGARDEIDSSLGDGTDTGVIVEKVNRALEEFDLYTVLLTAPLPEGVFNSGDRISPNASGEPYNTLRVTPFTRIGHGAIPAFRPRLFSFEELSVFAPGDSVFFFSRENISYIDPEDAVPEGFKSAANVAYAMALAAQDNRDLIAAATVEGTLSDTIYAAFRTEAGDADFSAADMISGQVITSFDDASLYAEDAGVSGIKNGVPSSALSVHFKDSDPFLERVELRWFQSSDVNVELEPGEPNSIADQVIIGGPFRGIKGSFLIKKAVCTDNSPFEISGLEPQADYQIDIRGISAIGAKGEWIRLPTAQSKSLASLYTATLTNKSSNVPSNATSGSFSVGGQFQVFTNDVRVTNNIFYSINKVNGVPASDATIDSTGVYTVTGISSSGNAPGIVTLQVAISDGVNTLVSDGDTLSRGGRYIITELGNTTQTSWINAGFPAGVTPQIGLPFTVTGSSVGTGKVSKALVEITRDFYLEKVIDSSDFTKVDIVHEFEESAGSGSYVPAPAFFKDGKEFSGEELIHTLNEIQESHQYTITSVGSSQGDWNTLAGTSGVTYLVGDKFISVQDGDSLGGGGIAVTTERNYRLRAVILVGATEDTSSGNYTFQWFRKKPGEAEGLVGSGIGMHTLNVNSEDISSDGENSYRVSVSTL